MCIAAQVVDTLLAQCTWRVNKTSETHSAGILGSSMYVCIYKSSCGDIVVYELE